MKRLYLLLAVAALLAPCQGYSQKVLSSFENKTDLKPIEVTHGVTISRSSEFPALGAYSLKTIFPKKGGAIDLHKLAATNWSDHDALLLFIWANQHALIRLAVTDASGDAARKKYALKAGANHVQLTLAKLKNIDLKNIKSLAIQAQQPATLYLDYLSLDQSQPALTKQGRWDIDYSNKVKTSHFSWGKPLVGGPIHTYSISPIFDGRGIIELAERLDIDHKVTTIGRSAGRNRWGFGAFYGRRNPNGWDDDHPYSLAFDYIADDLLFGPKYDVIIWPGIHKWNKYPEQIRNSVLKRVKNGAGLVLLYPQSNRKDNKGLWAISPLKRTGPTNFKNDGKSSKLDTGIWPHLDLSKWSKTRPHYITRGVALGALPWGHMGVLPYRKNKGKTLLKTAEGDPVLAVRKYGKGRVVALAYPERGLIPRVDNPWETGRHDSYWEYMWSLVARSVVWAAKREPNTAIHKLKRTSHGISAALSHVPKGAFLQVQIRDAFGDFEQKTKILLQMHQSRVEIKWRKRLHGGTHIINVELKGDKGVYDWSSLEFHTSQAARIQSIDASNSQILLGNQVHAKVLLTAKHFKGNLVARLYDNHKRLVSQKTYNIAFQHKQSRNITLDSKGVVSHLAKLDVLVQSNGKQVARKVKELFFLLPRNWRDYDIAMYNFGPNPVPGTWSAVNRQLQRLHVTTLAAYTPATSKHANYKIEAQTRIDGVESPDEGPDLKYYKSMKKKYLKTHNKKVLIRKYGLHDPAYLKSVQDELHNMIPKWRKFSPSAYYIYEEPSLTRYDDALDLSFSNKTLQAMRFWLKAQYGTLRALNQEWGTNYTQWKNVVPDDSREAQKRGNYSSWADHRTFMEKSWADLFKFVQKTTHELDPGGRVQLSGSQASGAFNGFDYSRLDHYVGQMNTYNIGDQLHFHRDFNPDLKLSGGAGYGALGKDVLDDYYEHLFLGETAGAYIFWQHSALRPDLALSKSGLAMKNGFEEMRGEGIGKLVGSYAPENKNKIAIEYSYPSIHGAWIVDGKIKLQKKHGHTTTSKTLEQFRKDRDGWVKILQDAGLGSDFIAYGSIANGGLIAKGYKVLILPMSIAISNKEVRQIQTFVKHGGTLIADALPGIMDGHAKLRQKRALAKVFGIEPRAYERADVVTPKHEVNLKLKGAKYLIKKDSRPELLYHKYGEGEAFLMNYFPDKYPKERKNNNRASALAKFKKLLDQANIQPSIRLTTTTGQQVNSITKYDFVDRNGSTRLLGLLPDKHGTGKGTEIHLDKSAHLYDIRHKKDLGEGKTFTIKVRPAVPELFGLVQGAVKAIQVRAPSRVKPGEKVSVNFQVAGKSLSHFNSVAHIDVYNPKGAKSDVYSGNYNINSGAGSFSFKTARNDLPGIWKIKITEVISGMEKQISINLQ